MTIKTVKENLEEAIVNVDRAHTTWSGCVTSLHMAELELRKAQRQLREAYSLLAEKFAD